MRAPAPPQNDAPADQSAKSAADGTNEEAMTVAGKGNRRTDQNIATWLYPVFILWMNVFTLCIDSLTSRKGHDFAKLDHSLTQRFIKDKAADTDLAAPSPRCEHTAETEDFIHDQRRCKRLNNGDDNRYIKGFILGHTPFTIYT